MGQLCTALRRGGYGGDGNGNGGSFGNLSVIGGPGGVVQQNGQAGRMQGASSSPTACENRSTYQVKPFYLSNRSTFQMQLVPLRPGRGPGDGAAAAGGGAADDAGRAHGRDGGPRTRGHGAGGDGRRRRRRDVR
jgi:hypothetical protein